MAYKYGIRTCTAFVKTNYNVLAALVDSDGFLMVERVASTDNPVHSLLINYHLTVF